MQEVNIRLRFISPCLGMVKQQIPRSRDVIYDMPRDGQGRVIFLASWWRSRMTYAAKVAGIGYDAVTKIDWSNHIDGLTTRWKRIVVPASDFKRARYALHEAFRPGAEIGVNAVLPDQLAIDDLRDLLNIVGTYKGISPFQSEEETYGTFEVLSVMPTMRQPVEPRRKAEKNST